jgi:predicted dehydrogenase
MITSEPLAGTRVPVAIATHVTGTLEFVSGATVSVTMSFDVPKHRHVPIELYGTKASMLVPDPNKFGGDIMLAPAGVDWEVMPTQHRYADGNYRSIGAADLAHALRAERPHRASGDLAFHVLEVMEAFQASSDRGAHVAIASRPDRPAMLPTDLQQGLLD